MQTYLQLTTLKWILIFGALFVGAIFFFFSANATAQSADFTISTSESNYDDGDAVTVSWTAAANRSSEDDWIGVYEVGARNNNFEDWEYIPNTQNSGTVTFRNLEPGTYEVRILLNDGFTSVSGVTDTFTIGADEGGGDAGDYSLTTNASTYEEGDTVSVAWTAPTNRTSDEDWIGVYKSGSNNRRFEDWSYIAGTGGSGTVTFDDLEPGTYEVRLLLNDGFTSVSGATDTFTITDGTGGDGDGQNGTFTVNVAESTYTEDETVSVAWTVSANRSSEDDWIGIYKVGSTDRRFEDWKYIPDAGGSGTLTFNDLDAGSYEVRVFLNDGFTRVSGVTDTFTVESGDGDESGDFSLSTNSSTYDSGDSISVAWTAPANRSSEDDWIGVYETGARNNNFEDWSYISDNQSSGTVTFRNLSAGTYEVRLFLNDGFTQVSGVTDTFTVTGGNGGGNNVQCSVSNLNQYTNYPADAGPIIAFGDSLTAGVGASNGQDYVSELEDILNVSIENEGISGNTTRDALSRLQRDVLSKNPSVVIVWLGGNDLLAQYYQRVVDGLEDPSALEYFNLAILRLGGSIPSARNIDEDETFENLTTIVERIQDTGAVVVLVGFSGGEFASGLEGRYEDVADATGALYVPDALGGIIGRPSLMSDFVHPNNEGYQRVAAKVAPVLSCVVPD